MRGKIALSAVVAMLGVFGYYIWRDLNLKNDLTFENLPDIVVEKLDFRRTIDGKEWHILADTAEHDSGLIKADTMVVDISDPESGRRTEMHATSGIFTQETSDVELRSIDARVYLTDRSIDIVARSAHYLSSDDLWQFREGIDMQDTGTHLTGETATIDADGVFTLERGAYARWNID